MLIGQARLPLLLDRAPGPFFVTRSLRCSRARGRSPGTVIQPWPLCFVVKGPTVPPQSAQPFWTKKTTSRPRRLVRGFAAQQSTVCGGVVDPSLSRVDLLFDTVRIRVAAPPCTHRCMGSMAQVDHASRGHYTVAIAARQSSARSKVLGNPVMRSGSGWRSKFQLVQRVSHST